MNLLALDTSTDRLSVALSCSNARGSQVWEFQGPGGAQSSATLIPAIEGLMRQAGLAFAQLQAIAFGRGPGSFTGLRTACAVAQGLGFGAGVPLLPVDTLLVVAETARLTHAPQARSLRVMAVLDARMDEVYAAPYAYENERWTALGDFTVSRPENVRVEADMHVAGNVFESYGHRLAGGGAAPWPVLPEARALLGLGPTLLEAGHAVPAAEALPLYIRDKVALTTEERAAVKAAQTLR